MRKNGISPAVALLLLVALTTTAARADDLPGVHATGVDDAGLVLAPGQLDRHWEIVSVPDGTPFDAPGSAIVAFPHPVYVGNDAAGGPGSSWIGATGSLRNPMPPGTYVYRTTIDVSGFDPETVQLTGRVAVDNSVVNVVVNGTPLGAAGGQFRDWTPLTIDAGFVAGENHVELVVFNAGADPSGLRVELSGTAEPLPAAVPVGVDVRPFAGDDVVNAASRGRLRVALLSADDVDATAIDPASVRLGAAAVGTTPDGRPMARFADVNGDGRSDLVLLFRIPDLGLTLTTTSLPLSGALADGTSVVGAGAVRVVDCCGVRALVRSVLGRWAERGWRGADEPTASRAARRCRP